MKEFISKKDIWAGMVYREASEMFVYYIVHGNKKLSREDKRNIMNKEARRLKKRLKIKSFNKRKKQKKQA